MRAVVQRVSEASVRIDGDTVGKIGTGLCVLVGVTHFDTTAEARRLADRLWNLRIFPDDEEKMNRSAADGNLPMLVISQFSLYADTSRGRRPSFVAAAPGEKAEPLVDELIAALGALGATVETGRFGAHMAVALVNDGPLTVTVET
ncbi:MAG: D-tyrosyl-tRNA(Tyr) deacylase [Acidimicrobiaceae bacterium]|nr:D-tyrosyl-tRNA(Tyr) deacylase [Acidimicrobiaceae bacterium]